MFLTRLALRNPIGVLMVCLSIMGLAWITSKRMPIDMFPGLNVPALSISTGWPGANPEEVERSVTQPLEQAVSLVNGIVRVQSTSSAGNSHIQLWFDWGANLDSALVQVIAAVQKVQRALPPGIDAPSVGQFDVTNWPAVQVAIQGPGMDPRQLLELAQYTLLPQLARIQGIAGVGVAGGRARQINVNCDPQRMQARGLSLQDVQDALRANNQLVPSGLLQNPKVEYQLKIPTLLQDVKAIEQVVVATRNRIQIKLRDVATVEDGSSRPTSVYKVNGQPGVGLQIYRQPQANLVRVSEEVIAAVPQLAGVPKGVELKVVTDQARYVRKAAESLIHEGLFGAFLVAVVVLIFLRDVKSVLIICVSLPLSVAAALAMLYFADQSLNVFTLGGLTLALGRLVDDAIVVRENITRHLEEHPSLSPTEAVLAATGEVGMPVLASTLTTIAVFVPVVFMEGMSQRLFVPLAMTIVFAMVASYFVSMTVDPVLSLVWKHKPRPQTERPGLLERAFVASEAFYERSLRFSMAHGAVVVVLLAVAIAHSLWLWPSIPSEFFPESDEGVVSVTLQSQQGTPLQRSEWLAEQAAEIVRKEVKSDELVALVLTAGGPSNHGRLLLRLTGIDQRKRSSKDIAKALRKALADRWPGVRVFVGSGGMMKAILNYGATAPINLQLLGYDQEVGLDTAAQIGRAIGDVPGISDVNIVPQGQVPSFEVDIDRERASLLGITPVQVANTINTAIFGGGGAAARFLDPITGYEFKLVTQLTEEYRSRPEDIEAVPIGVLFSTPTSMRSAALEDPGTPLFLRDVANVKLGAAPLQIRRKNQVRVIDVNANNTEPLGPVTAGVKEALQKVKLPDGFSLVVSGQSEQQERAFATMTMAAGLALALVYMIMATQFGNLWEPLVIMTTVPLGLVGVVWMQKLSGTPFSVMSFMGVIMMVGIVVSNGILIVEFAKTLQERGMPLGEAVVVASRTRLRPILMTAIATLVGMIPMATGLGGGSETNIPLARAVIGGLSLSTVLTLYLVPQFYRTLGRWLGPSE